MCVFGMRPQQMLNLPGPEGWKAPKVPKLDDISFGIIAWRTWNLRQPWPPGGEKAGELTGNFLRPWLPNKAMTLLPGYGTTPRPGGKLSLSSSGYEGVYAYKKEVRVRNTSVIWGEVLLWGPIAEYRSGYRAQYAYPLSFFAPDAVAADALVKMGWPKYGVYINRYSRLAEGADKYGYVEHA